MRVSRYQSDGRTDNFRLARHPESLIVTSLIPCRLRPPGDRDLSPVQHSSTDFDFKPVSHHAAGFAGCAEISWSCLLLVRQTEKYKLTPWRQGPALQMLCDRARSVRVTAGRRRGERCGLAGASVIRGRRGLICPRRAKKGRKSIQPIRDPFA